MLQRVGSCQKSIKVHFVIHESFLTLSKTQFFAVFGSVKSFNICTVDLEADSGNTDVSSHFSSEMIGI